MRCALVISIVLVSSTGSSADETAPERTYIQTIAPRDLCKPSDADPALKVCRAIPPGRFLDEPSWLEMDAKLVELENTRTRLTAENSKLRDAVSGWQPGWKTLAMTLIVGVAGGVATYHYFDR